MSVVEPSWLRKIAVYRNERFICMVTDSGYRGGMEDPLVRPRFLPTDASYNDLGTAATEALKASRVMSLDEFRAARPGISERYEERVADAMRSYGYTSKRTFFKNMIMCGVTDEGEVLRITPTRHDRLEGWEGLERESAILIDSSVPVQEFGVAIRLGLERSV